MRIASVPLNEELRLQDLYSYDILNGESEKSFDDLLEVASEICRCPLAAITFIDEDKQWIKAKKGIDPNIVETSRDIAFCAHAILQDEILIINDAQLDKRFFDNPLVTGDLGIRFYAGAPIISNAGYKLGAVCVLDTRPRQLLHVEAKMLKIISQQISKLLELRLKNNVIRKRAEEQLLFEKLLLEKTLKQHDKERLQISTELHENIAQGLAATKFYLELAEDDGIAKADLIKKCKGNIVNLVKQVRDLSKSITPSALKESNLKESLEVLLEKFYSKNNIHASLIYEGKEDLQADLAIAIYRMIQDQLENIKHHAKATNVVINVNVCQAIHISISDNGLGVDISKLQKGAGINKILSRIESYNGNINISGGMKSGCRLTITIPTCK